jgi:death-on-curing protein
LPGSEVQHLTLEEVVVLHERLLGRFGGAPGLRDPGLLESALYRPRTGYYRDVAEMAAALMESLLMNHPFVDGNKRCAFFATDVFLRLNGWAFRVDARPAHDFLIGLLEDGTCDFAHLLPWIRKTVRRTPPAGAAPGPPRRRRRRPSR